MTALHRGAVIARWWRTHVVGEVHHAAVVAQISEQSGWSGAYLFAIVISAGISILGLLLPSSAVLIGAMLISPLMMPIIGLGFGIATFDLAEMRRAGIALALGSLIAVALSAAFVAVSPIQTVTSEIAIRTRPNLFDLLVALLSALAGGYALIRERSTTVVGVAIAIALMPPLAVVGFGLATQNWTVLGGSLLLFLTNLVTIALTAAVVARLYGFGAHLSPTQTRLQGLLIVIGLAALAIPLALALKQIAVESVARRQIRDAVLMPFGDAARISQLDIDFDRRPVMVRAAVLTPAVVPDADARAVANARRAVAMPLDLHVDQIRVGFETGAGEAAQIAAARPGDRAGQVAGTRERMAGVVARIAGVPADALVVDSEARRIAGRFAPLPGATLSTYRALEARAAADGWTVMLTPPPIAPDPVRFTDGVPDAAGLADLAWGAERLGQGVAIAAGDAQFDALAAALARRGIGVTREPGSGPPGGAGAAWIVPARSGP